MLIKSMKKGVELDEGQAKVFRDLEDLFKGEDKWKRIDEITAGIHMQIKKQPPKKGERTLLLGRAECVADC